MKKYRIIKVEYKDSTPSYRIQKRFLFIFWETMYFRINNVSYLTSYFETFEEADSKIKTLKSVEIQKTSVVS